MFPYRESLEAMTKNILKPFDFLFLALSLSAAVFSIILIKNGTSEKEARLVITADNSEYIYPLNKDRSIEIEGDTGISIIEIKDGKAFFKDSPCPNKLCVEMSAVKETNDWAACMPNNVFIRID